MVRMIKLLLQTCASCSWVADNANFQVQEPRSLLVTKSQLERTLGIGHDEILRLAPGSREQLGLKRSEPSEE